MLAFTFKNYGQECIQYLIGVPEERIKDIDGKVKTRLERFLEDFEVVRLMHKNPRIFTIEDVQ